MACRARSAYRRGTRRGRRRPRNREASQALPPNRHRDRASRERKRTPRRWVSTAENGRAPAPFCPSLLDNDETLEEGLFLRSWSTGPLLARTLRFCCKAVRPGQKSLRGPAGLRSTQFGPPGWTRTSDTRWRRIGPYLGLTIPRCKRFPKPRAQVRFLPGASPKSPAPRRKSSLPGHHLGQALKVEGQAETHAGTVI